MRVTVCALLGATSLFTLSTAASAADTGGGTTAEAAATAETAETEPTIVVTGQRPEYGIKSTTAGTKTDTLVRNIPQAMSVVSEAQIQDQSLRSVGDLLLFVPGATPGTGESNRDQLTLRGNNTTADFFVDGLRDDAQYFRDFYNLDRVEVLKGPNAMIFGRGGGGGIINRVTKRASLTSNQDLILSHDSEGGSRVTADVDLPVAGALGLRVNSVWEKADSFRRHTGIKRYGINPTVGFVAGPDTRIDVSYEYFHDRRTADRGVPSLDGRPVEGFDRSFFGDPGDSYSDADVQIASLAAEHRFSDALKIRHRTLLADYDKFYQNIYPSGAVNPVTDAVALGAYNSRNDRRNLISQTDLIWDGTVAGIDQTLLVGFEVGRQRSRNHRQSGTFVPGEGSVTLADPTVNREVTFATIGTDANNRTRATIAAGYLQTQLRPSDMFEIVAGLRFDRFRLSVDDARPGIATFSRTDELWSPRLGLIFKPATNLSLYTGYSRSYLPQSGDQFGSLSTGTEELKPERFDNYEIGAKWEPVDGLLATAAVYQLDRSNARLSDPARPGFFLLSGKQRTRGLELGLERSINARWQVSAGYALQDAEIRSPIQSGSSPIPAGNKVPLVPRHSASLWTKYQFTKPFAAGVGVLARSKSYAAADNLVVLPGYARVDGALYYKLAPGIEVQVNVENLFNKDYFPTAHNNNNIAPGAPRTARVTLRTSL